MEISACFFKSGQINISGSIVVIKPFFMKNLSRLNKLQLFPLTCWYDSGGGYMEIFFAGRQGRSKAIDAGILQAAFPLWFKIFRGR